jgi:hypothetical protein
VRNEGDGDDDPRPQIADQSQQPAPVVVVDSWGGGVVEDPTVAEVREREQDGSNGGDRRAMPIASTKRDR